MEEVKSADAVVIGGGARGCSIALFLARAGVRVALVERRTLNSMASSGNGAQVNVTAKEPDYYTAMSLKSARMYPEFIASLESDVFLQQEGLLHVTTHPKELEAFRQRVEVRNRVPGLQATLLDAREARDILPAVGPEVIGGYISRADGIVDVLQLISAIGRAARRAGAVILRGTEVTGIEVAGGRVQKVLTSRGSIATPVVVNAAGVHVPHIGRMLGVTIPVEPEHGHMAITQAHPRMLPVPTQHVAQWPSGTFTIGTTNKNLGFDNGVRPGMLPPFLQEALHILPGLRNVGILRVFAHLRPMPPDRLPIYDRAPGLEGFYIAVGHSGITLAPLTGKIFADLIVHARTDVDLSPYSLKRFAGSAN
ncbi:MAG TPA: FAD-binding oxidoreductase [Candidatus Methylomirabilis sp.]|nr:FAD-binding oxidoreductase [Candidatus Methylomirabilis sp.]